MEQSTVLETSYLSASSAHVANALKRRGIDCEESQAHAKCSRLSAADVGPSDDLCTGHSNLSRQPTTEHHASTSGTEAGSWGHGPLMHYQTCTELRPSCQSAQPRLVNPLLPSALPSGKAGTLVLDMDKTLIFKEWRLQPFDRRPQIVYRPDFNFHITYRGYPVQYHVKKRPFLDGFLQHAATLFEVVLFTASESIVTLPVVKQLDPKGTLIHHVLCRDACTEREGLYVKDLTRLGRDLARTVIIDDNPDSFLWQPENAVLVGEFCGWEEHDQELLRLTPLLDMLALADDMRSVVADLAGMSDRQEEEEEEEEEGAEEDGAEPSGEHVIEVVQVMQQQQQQQPGTPDAPEDVQEEQSEDSVVYY